MQDEKGANTSVFFLSVLAARGQETRNSATPQRRLVSSQFAIRTPIYTTRLFLLVFVFVTKTKKKYLQKLNKGLISTCVV